jgi:hypothetical protein
MSFHNEISVKKTRNTCKCNWCWWPIEKGQPSIYRAGVYEGDFFTARYHPECSSAVRRWYEVNDAWGEPMPEYRMNRGGIFMAGEIEEVSDEKEAKS